MLKTNIINTFTKFCNVQHNNNNKYIVIYNCCSIIRFKLCIIYYSCDIFLYII